MRLPILLATVCAIYFYPNHASSQTATHPDRQVAITIDDLPAGMADRTTGADIVASRHSKCGSTTDLS